MKPRNIRETVVLIMAVTVSVSVVALVGSAVYAIIANTIDWTTDHVKGPNITSPLATLIGSLLSAVIAGVVGYVSGARSVRKQETSQEPGEHEKAAPPDEGVPAPGPIDRGVSAVNDILDRVKRRGS